MTETYTYDSYGNLATIKIGGRRVWELSSYNGTYRTIKLGEAPLTLSKSYSPSSGALSSATISNSSGPLHIFSYTFDGSGNLTNRYGMTNGNETFSYDEFDRLKTGVSYFINGNINSKTGIGNYTYDANKKNAVVQVQNSGNLIPKENVDVTYNAFNKVATVTQGSNKLTITYGPDRQRVKTVLMYGGTTTTTLYAGNYEQRTAGSVTTTYHYVASPDGLIAVYVKKNGTTTPYYVETDHLGSIINLFDASGTKQFSATYDAWGKQTITKNAMGLTRGYTGHEHWNQFGLIDMNGRFYDPLIGRFLSPDPYIQAPSNLQNFNRYSYCLNNPLKYTDPSGNISEFAAFFIFNTISQGLWKGVEAVSNDESFWKGFGKGAATGALITLAGLGITKLANYAYNSTMNTNPATAATPNVERVSYPLIEESCFPNEIAQIPRPELQSFGDCSIMLGEVTVTAKRMTFDVTAAIENIYMYSYESYQLAIKIEGTSYCGRHVRNALEAGFDKKDLGFTDDHVKTWGKRLEELGFNPINTSEYKSGDIAIFQGPGGLEDANGVPYGHIQMYDGNHKQWISNWRQAGFWPGRRYLEKSGPFQIYRWR